MDSKENKTEKRKRIINIIAFASTVLVLITYVAIVLCLEISNMMKLCLILATVSLSIDGFSYNLKNISKKGGENDE